MSTTAANPPSGGKLQFLCWNGAGTSRRGHRGVLAVGRWLLPEHSVSFVIVCLTPILAAVAYDGLRYRRVHPILAAGFAFYLLRLSHASYSFGLGKYWQPVGKALLAPFLN